MAQSNEPATRGGSTFEPGEKRAAGSCFSKYLHCSLSTLFSLRMLMTNRNGLSSDAPGQEDAMEWQWSAGFHNREPLKRRWYEDTQNEKGLIGNLAVAVRSSS